jgi:hypothetical protein
MGNAQLNGAGPLGPFYFQFRATFGVKSRADLWEGLANRYSNLATLPRSGNRT